MTSRPTSGAFLRRCGILAALALAAVLWTSAVAKGDVQVSLSGGFAPALQHAGELGAGSDAGFGLDASFVFIPVPRWEFGLQTGFWRWSGQDACSPHSRDACGYESMTCIPMALVVRHHLGESPPLFYVQAEAGPHRLTWGYKDEAWYNPHQDPKSLFGAGVGGGALLPLSDVACLNLALVLTQLWTDPEMTRYARVLVGVTLGPRASGPRR
jgi:hypothetical protein